MPGDGRGPIQMNSTFVRVIELRFAQSYEFLTAKDFEWHHLDVRSHFNFHGNVNRCI